MPTAALVSLTALAALAAPAAPVVPAARDFQTLDVCSLVSGEAVARALGGTLAEARTAPGRCAYLVVPAGQAAAARRGYVVWIQEPDDYEVLKEFIEAPLTPLDDLGDAAYLFRDSGDGRFKINVLKRGDLMLQATGESAEAARKVAEAAWAELARPRP